MSRISFPLTPAIIGFCVGIGLCGYAFYLTAHREIGSPFLFLLLCPPSILAMALDNAGALGALVGWLFISFANAGFYALIWTLLPLRRAQDSHHE
jgi:hypothetical protein